MSACTDSRPALPAPLRPRLGAFCLAVLLVAFQPPAQAEQPRGTHANDAAPGSLRAASSRLIRDGTTRHDTSMGGSPIPASDAVFVRTADDGNDPVSGTVAGLSNGDAVALNGAPVSNNDAGGDGNDVVITGVPLPATVLSIERASSSPTNAPVRTWIARFDTPISGLTAANFALAVSGLGGTPAISGVSAQSPPPATSWNISATTGTGNGTLGLNLVDATGLSHSLTNLPFVGQEFVLDRTPPTLSISVMDDNLVGSETSPVNFVFSEPVSALPQAAITAANGSLSQPETIDFITWNAVFTPADGVFDASNVIMVDMSQVADLPGNAGVGTAFSNNYAIDTRTRSLGIDDVTQVEGDSGTVNFTFTVSLDLPAADDVSFDIATADGTATVAGNDYVPRSLTAVLIPGGQTSTTFTVQVNGDTAVEPDETFFVTVTNIVNALAGDTQGVGTILNDDADTCAGFSFPYTLSGADNAARVANLRQAIHCANANATADVIDLAGAVLLFADADPGTFGDAALPNVTSALTLRNGTLQRDAAAADFRLLTIEDEGEFIGETLAFRNGRSSVGGAIHNDGTMALRDAGFFDNGDRVQTAEGGAIYHGSSYALRIVDSRFEGNAATWGGAVFVRSGDLWMRGSLLQDNEADEGGALYSESVLIRLFDNAFVDNQARRGGAIKFFGGQISGTRFEGNAADELAGAVNMESGFLDLFVSNSLFIGNEAPDAAVLVGADSTTHLHNVTISGHAAGPGNLLGGSGGIVIANSIVWDNGGRPLGTATVRHSLIEGGYAGGTDIIDMDPRFADAANGDFRLASGSPVIDAGNNDDVRFDTWWDIDDDGDFDEELEDLDGNPRRHDDAGVVDTGAGTAPIVDLGAYERQTDSGAPGISVNPTSGLVTSETGDTATFTVVLDTQPSADVDIALGSSDATEGTVAPAGVTFTVANWNIPQTVTVTGVDDNEDDGDIAYEIVTAAATSADANYNGIDPDDVSVTNTDNDTAGITVNPTSGLVTTEGVGPTGTAGVDQFRVVLDSQPTADVTIGLGSSDTTEGTPSLTSLTFTPANWNTPQAVNVLSVDDNEVDGDIAYTILTAAAVSGDANYNAIDPADVSVTNRDNDTAGITVNPTSGLVTTEAGGTATFAMVLDTQPSADVSIAFSSSDTTEGTVTPASLTFTAANWNILQTVTVTGVDDNEVDGDVGYEIVTAAATSADANYNGIDPDDVSVTNTDNDSAGISVNPTSGLVTTEAGDTATFTVVLDTQPSADVSIGLASSDTTEGTVAPASLTFTAANWNILQTVTVTGVDDNEVDGDVGYEIVTAAATSADANYSGVNPANVQVTNTDNDSAGISVNPTSGLVTTEAGDTATFTVVLDTQPSADVSIALSSSDTTEGTASPASLTFTAANWNVAQTVTVTGVDDNEADGDIAYDIVTAAATSADANYNGIDPDDVSVTNTDNDSAGITVNPTSGLVTTEAGDTATFTVVLDTQPSADVSIALSSSDTSEGTVAPASLTFTAANWNILQTVTVTGVDDNEVDGDVAYEIVTAAATSADATYNGVDPDDVSVANTDNDTAGILLAATNGSLVTSELGDSDTFTIALATMPGADVTLPITSTDTGEGSVSPASLVFTSGNWNVPQTVTVTGVNDAQVDGDQGYQIDVGPATSADPSYSGLIARIAAVNVDDDVAGAGPPRPVPFGGFWAMLVLLLTMMALAAEALARRR